LGIDFSDSLDLSEHKIGQKKIFDPHPEKIWPPGTPTRGLERVTSEFDELGYVGYQFYSDFSKENEYPKILNGNPTGWDPLGYPEGPPRTPLVYLMKAWHVGY